MSRITIENFSIVSVPASPLAGIDVAFTVPNGKLWNIQSLWITLTTDATVAVRGTYFYMSQGALNYHYSTIVNTSASTTATFEIHCAPSPGTLSSLFNVYNMPNLWLPAGATFKTATSNLQAADQYAISGAIIYERFMQ